MSRATRFSAATAAWSSVVDLSAPLVNLAVAPPDLATTDAGDALVSWRSLGNAVEAARWPAGGSAWGPAATVATMPADMTRAAVDSAGNGVVIWTSYTTRRQLWASRNIASTTWGARDRAVVGILRFSVNAPGVDNASTTLLGSANVDRLALSWTNVANGAPLSGVRLTVGGSIVTAVDLPPTESFTFDHVPPGTYTFTVSPLGPTPGAPSNVVTLTFPGACAGPPNPPTAFSASTQAGLVYLDWLPPAGGAAATSYVVRVSGAFNGSLPMTARTLAAPAPSGSYTVEVTSVGPCGTSAATPPQTVVVP